jgi:hypothetical protein
MPTATTPTTDIELFPKDKNGRTEYRSKDGKKLPSVTQIVGESLGGWAKDALMYWAWQEGTAGRNFRDKTQEAADIGTIAHLMIDAFLNDRDPDLGRFSSDEEIHKIKRAQIPFESFLTWYMTNELDFHCTERQMVSNLYHFGGTMDGLATVNGQRAIIDYKSSRHIYASILAQLGGYSLLWEEAGKELINRAHAIHIGKEGEFGVYTFTPAEIGKGRVLFHHAHSIFKMKRELDPRIRELRKENKAKDVFTDTPAED